MIIPLFDIDLSVLSANQSVFEENHIRVLVSSEETVAICNDKWLTYSFLRKHGFYTPKTFIHLEEIIEKLTQKDVSFPLIVKPRWGMGSIGVYLATNREELNVFYRLCQRVIVNTYIQTGSSAPIDESVLIQEQITGMEYSMDVINNLHGRFMSAIPHQKLASRAGEVNHAKVDLKKSLLDLRGHLGRTVQHIGNLDVDLFLCGDQPYVIELNARFGGTYPFSHIAGVNLPKAILKWLEGEDVGFDLLTATDGVEGFKHISASVL